MTNTRRKIKNKISFAGEMEIQFSMSVYNFVFFLLFRTEWDIQYVDFFPSMDLQIHLLRNCPILIK